MIIAHFQPHIIYISLIFNPQIVVFSPSRVCLGCAVSVPRNTPCPVCVKDNTATALSNFDELKQDTRMSRDILALVTRCPQQGCSWAGVFEKYHTHVATCRGDSPLQFCPYRCGKLVHPGSDTHRHNLTGECHRLQSAVLENLPNIQHRIQQLDNEKAMELNAAKRREHNIRNTDLDLTNQVWRVEKVTEVIEGRRSHLDSPHIYTGIRGVHLGIQLYTHVREGEDYIGLNLIVYKNDWDGRGTEWPVPMTTVVSLVQPDTTRGRDRVARFKVTLQRPGDEPEVVGECREFVRLDEVKTFADDDNVFFRFGLWITQY